MEVVFSITPRRTEETPSSIGFRAPPGQQTSGKGTSPVTINSNSHKFGTPLEPVKRPRSFGRYGTKR